MGRQDTGSPRPCQGPAPAGVGPPSNCGRRPLAARQAAGLPRSLLYRAVTSSLGRAPRDWLLSHCTQSPHVTAGSSQTPHEEPAD